MKIRQRGGDKGRKIAAPQADGGAPVLDYPVFCLRYLQGSHDVRDCNDDQQRQLIQQLRALSQLTWAEIRGAHRHGLGAEKIERSSLKKPLPRNPTITDDVAFLAFRFAGRAPMIGYRSGAVFRIIWLDHDFSVYDH